MKATRPVGNADLEANPFRREEKVVKGVGGRAGPSGLGYEKRADGRRDLGIRPLQGPNLIGEYGENVRRQNRVVGGNGRGIDGSYGVRGIGAAEEKSA